MGTQDRRHGYCSWIPHTGQPQPAVETLHRLGAQASADCATGVDNTRLSHTKAGHVYGAQVPMTTV